MRKQKRGPTAVLLWSVAGLRVVVGVGQAGADELLQDGLGYGHHHGGGGRVAEPHWQEDRAAHEAQHQPEPQGKIMSCFVFYYLDVHMGRSQMFYL